MFIVFITRYTFNMQIPEQEALQDTSYEQLAAQAWALEPPALAAVFAKWANAGEPAAIRWMNRLYRDGMSPTWLDAIDRQVRRVELVHTYRLSESREEFELQYRPWGRIHPVRDKLLFDTVDTVFAWVLMRLYNAGIAKKVKHCESTGCTDFHFRRGKWCSDTCGSRERVRDKRIKDKRRQML